MGLVGAIRDGDWKYIRDATYEGGVLELLYNIKLDFKETIDLSKVIPSITKRMKSLFEELSLSVVSEDNPPEVEGNPHFNEQGYVQSGWCDV